MHITLFPPRSMSISFLFSSDFKRYHEKKVKAEDEYAKHHAKCAVAYKDMREGLTVQRYIQRIFQTWRSMDMQQGWIAQTHYVSVVGQKSMGERDSVDALKHLPLMQQNLIQQVRERQCLRR